MNNITFTANLLISRPEGFENSKMAKRNNLAEMFYMKTMDDQCHSLILKESNNEGSDEFILKKNEWESSTVVAKFRTNFTCDLDKLSDKEATERLVDIFDVMKIKAEQNRIIRKKIDSRDSIVEKRDKEIRELDTEQKLEFIYEMKKRGLKSDTMDFPELAD